MGPGMFKGFIPALIGIGIFIGLAIAGLLALLVRLTDHVWIVWK